MKKTICGIIVFIIVMTTIFITLPEKTQAISEVINNTSKEEHVVYLERKAEWEEKYINKEIVLDISIKVIIAIIIFNVILFSILLYKGKKLESIYKIIQIALLFLLELLYTIKFYIPLPPLPPGAVYSAKIRLDTYIIQFAIIEICILYINELFQKKNKSQLLIGSIISGAIFIIYEIIKASSIVLVEENILKVLSYIALTNILFLPLYLSKKELEEEENVRL